MRPRTCATLFTVASLTIANSSAAQLKGHYVPGFTGLQNGSMAPPGITVAVPWYFYTTDRILDETGKAAAASPRVNVSFTGLAVSWSTNYKVGGARYGASIVPVAFIKSRIEGNNLDVPDSFSFTDIEVDPVSLVWESKQADFIFNYAFFAPTGKWELGGRDNAGLGMWSNLFQTGTTVRLDSEGEWTISLLGSYEIHSKKKNTNIEVGDIATFEGGIGKTFVKVSMIGNNNPVPTRILNLGIVSYGQLKMTDDKAGPITSLLTRDRVLAVGGEGDLILPLSGWVVGLRIEPEFGARNRTEGWMSLLTIAYSVQ